MPNYKYIFGNKNSLLFLALSLFFISNLILLLLANNVWWDASVYAGMGKYIFSSGNAGLWESSRPLAWPIILGFIWKLNLDAVLFGKLISLFFSAGILLFTYIIGKEIFGRKTALLSVLLLALTPTFFFFSKIMLSETISTFFILVAVYLLIKKKYLFSGLFFGIAFMTRFLQLVPFLAAIIIFLIYNKAGKKPIKDILKIIIGFIIPVAPYLGLNYTLYNNPLFPFIQQIFLTQNTGWMWIEPWWFYFLQLFKENFLYIFAFLGIYFLFKDKMDYEKSLIFSLFLMQLLLFILIPHKEMRFLIAVMPFMYMAASYGITGFFEFNRKFMALLYLLIILFAVNSSAIIYSNEKEEIGKNSNLIAFQEYLEKENLGNIWISNPAYAAYSDKKIDTLIYYPAFDRQRADFLNSNLLNADTILLDTCDIPCHPMDSECQREKENFINNAKNQFKAHYSRKYGSCEQIIAKEARIFSLS
ncbi:glycosyltransferase family 39 protein [Candidatus Woesearchaeota archaeon]|nr:glycosyltransferase family 39 protein [Candidatus Woesearchaeota archaeon]